jgi:hypothetical protein
MYLNRARECGPVAAQKQFRQLAVLLLPPRHHVPGEGINNNAGIPGYCDPGADTVYTV